jgi:inhibitor of cysteine peptidase
MRMSRRTGLELVAWLGLLGVVMSALVGCSHQDPVALGEADSGHTVKTRPGRHIVVTLPSNPTTGYTWTVSNLGGLQQIGDARYTSAETERAGAGGTQTFTFSADDRTAGQLILEYRRPWEEDSAPARTWSVAVSVE